MSNNQDLTLVVDFTIIVPSDLWDGVELSYNENEYSFYDADLISLIDGIVTASIKLESSAIWTTPERATKYFDEYRIAEPNIQFGDYIAHEKDTKLYKVREYGI